MQTLWQFYLIIGIGMGVGMTCMGNLAWHRTIISWFDHWRGRAIALGVLGASLAGVVMPPLVTALVEQIGWRGGFATFAAVTALILVPPVVWLLRDRPEEVGEVRDGHRYVMNNPQEMVDIPEDARAWHWREMMRFPAFWSIGLIFGSMGCVYSAVMLHLFGHARDLGLSGANAATVLSITALFAALGKPVVGWMSDAVGARITIWFALLMQAAALLVFAFATSYAATLVAGVMYGFGYAGMSPLRTFAISVSMGSASFGNANGILRRVELPLVLAASATCRVHLRHDRQLLRRVRDTGRADGGRLRGPVFHPGGRCAGTAPAPGRAGSGLSRTWTRSPRAHSAPSSRSRPRTDRASVCTRHSEACPAWRRISIF